MKKRTPYWVYPGVKKGLSRIKTRHKQSIGSELVEMNVTIDPKHYYLSIWKDTQLSMNLKPKDFVDFIRLNDKLFLVKVKTANSGYSLHNNNSGRSLRCEPRLFIRALIKEFGLTKTIRLKVEKQKSEFNGNPLFEIKLDGYMLMRRKNRLPGE